MSFLVTGIGVGLTAIAGGIKYGSARKAELKANKASNKAADQANLKNAELAARERRSFVPGFGDSDNIPGYTNDMMGPQPGSAGIMRSREGGGIYTTGNYGGGGFQGLNPYKNPAGFYGDDDSGLGAPRNEIKFDPAGNMIFNEAAITRSVQKKLTANKEFMKYTQGLPRSEDDKPIFPDPNTAAGSKFYKQLPKSVAAMAGNPKFAQMYKGSNIVNPYANIQDLSAVLEDVSDIYQDRTGLLKDRSDMFRGTAELGVDLSDQEDLSKRFGDLTTGMEDLSGRVADLRQGAQDYSGLATDSSILASNPYANLQVATQAADLKAQQSDQALANTLSTIRATGAGAGGATAIAQAALQSKLGIAATIEQQETRNVQARAEGQQQIEQIRMSESQRLQNISLTEKLRLESLRQTEGRRIDETKLTEGRTLRQLGLEEGRSLRQLEVDEGRALRGLAVSEGQRMQGLGISDRLREQELQQGESLRLQNAEFNEAQRLQDMDYNEAIRIQSARFNEQQRLQEADSMAREYQFRVAETREQNRLNRLHNMATQAVQTSADLEASKIAAKAQRQGALVGAIGGVASAVVSAVPTKAATSAATGSSSDFSKFLIAQKPELGPN
ncbi:MAG: hypothetical protein HN905_03200 [Candidatus Marinimicrobia bacterium]|jgi:hypothetical protein|nr:hypothetical protein [Candidatus Neomarinimicrobiota bacterium]